MWPYQEYESPNRHSLTKCNEETKTICHSIFLLRHCAQYIDCIHVTFQIRYYWRMLQKHLWRWKIWCVIFILIFKHVYVILIVSIFHYSMFLSTQKEEGNLISVLSISQWILCCIVIIANCKGYQAETTPQMSNETTTTTLSTSSISNEKGKFILQLCFMIFISLPQVLDAIAITIRPARRITMVRYSQIPFIKMKY